MILYYCTTSWKNHMYFLFSFFCRRNPTTRSRSSGRVGGTYSSVRTYRCTVLYCINGMFGKWRLYFQNGDLGSYFEYCIRVDNVYHDETPNAVYLYSTFHIIPSLLWKSQFSILATCQVLLTMLCCAVLYVGVPSEYIDFFARVGKAGPPHAHTHTRARAHARVRQSSAHRHPDLKTR